MLKKTLVGGEEGSAGRHTSNPSTTRTPSGGEDVKEKVVMVVQRFRHQGEGGGVLETEVLILQTICHTAVRGKKIFAMEGAGKAVSFINGGRRPGKRSSSLRQTNSDQRGAKSLPDPVKGRQ